MLIQEDVIKNKTISQIKVDDETFQPYKTISFDVYLESIKDKKVILNNEEFDSFKIQIFNEIFDTN